MIIYSVEHDMTVWIILVEMTDNDVGNDVWSIHSPIFFIYFWVILEDLKLYGASSIRI